MRRTSVKVNLRSPRSTATSTINTCFCFPPGAPLLALERIAIVAHIFRVAQIPIAERAAPSAHFTRGFVPWRLSDDGPGASRTVSMAVIRNPSQQLTFVLICVSSREPRDDLVNIRFREHLDRGR